MICSTCNHDSKTPEPHKPGACKRCNCGESGIAHLTAPDFFYGPFDWSNNLFAWGDRLSENVRPADKSEGGY